MTFYIDFSIDVKNTPIILVINTTDVKYNLKRAKKRDILHQLWAAIDVIRNFLHQL